MINGFAKNSTAPELIVGASVKFYLAQLHCGRWLKSFRRVEEVANAKGVSMAQVALAWAMSKPGTTLYKPCMLWHTKFCPQVYLHQSSEPLLWKICMTFWVCLPMTYRSDMASNYHVLQALCTSSSLKRRSRNWKRHTSLRLLLVIHKQYILAYLLAAALWYFKSFVSIQMSSNRINSIAHSAYCYWNRNLQSAS